MNDQAAAAAQMMMSQPQMMNSVSVPPGMMVQNPVQPPQLMSAPPPSAAAMMSHSQAMVSQQQQQQQPPLMMMNQRITGGAGGGGGGYKPWGPQSLPPPSSMDPNPKMKFQNNPSKFRSKNNNNNNNNWKGKNVNKDLSKSLNNSSTLLLPTPGASLPPPPSGYKPPSLNELQNQNRMKARKYFHHKKKFNNNNNNNNRFAPYAPRNTTSFIIRAKKSGGIASLVSPCPVTPAVLPTPIFSPSREVLGDMAKEEWGVDGYGSMKGLIRLRSPGNDAEDDDEEGNGSSESDVEEHVEVERRLDHDLSRFEMIYPNYAGADYGYNNVLENRVDDQDTHIAQLEEENLTLKERLFLMERELGDLRRRLQFLERQQGRKTTHGSSSMVVVEDVNEEVVENVSENDENESDGGSDIGGGAIVGADHTEDVMEYVHRIGNLDDHGDDVRMEDVPNCKVPIAGDGNFVKNEVDKKLGNELPVNDKVPVEDKLKHRGTEDTDVVMLNDNEGKGEDVGNVVAPERVMSKEEIYKDDHYDGKNSYQLVQDRVDALKDEGQDEKV